jgi:hypothetical protein
VLVIRNDQVGGTPLVEPQFLETRRARQRETKRLLKDAARFLVRKAHLPSHRQMMDEDYRIGDVGKIPVSTFVQEYDHSCGSRNRSGQPVPHQNWNVPSRLMAL